MHPLLHQTRVLTAKNLLIVVGRHPVSSLLRALIIPLAIALVIAYSKLLFNSHQRFGIGAAFDVYSLPEALSKSQGRDVVGFVDNGLTGGDISSVIKTLSDQVAGAGKTPKTFSSNKDLNSACVDAENGVSACYGAVVFNSSPDEPHRGGHWNYTLRGDGSLGLGGVDVDSPISDTSVYFLPLQKAVDDAIYSLNNTGKPLDSKQLSYTSQTEAARKSGAQQSFINGFTSYFGIIVFLALVGVVYHMSSFISRERQIGMSQLVDAMAPASSKWRPRISRMSAAYLAFSVLYFPSWLAVGIILAVRVFINSSGAITVIFHLLTGFALCSYSALVAAFFKRPQLSAIVATIVAVALAIIPQVLDRTKQTGPTVIGMSLFFPFSNYAYFIATVGRWEEAKQGVNLAEVAPNSPFQIPGYVFWIFLVLQIFLYPLAALYIEGFLWGTASPGRKFSAPSESGAPLRIRNFCKTYSQSWFLRLFQGSKPRVQAVKNLNLDAHQGQILMLLGPNGSGKSTTLDSIGGLCKVTSGSIEVEIAGGFGMAPQNNVFWNELTVAEHIKVFVQLKSPGADAAAETATLISACDLAEKAKARSKTLSGGQKRKLQLAMMFAGGSSVCCIDEVSTGLDPLSRRKIWDIILSERSRRTIVMTTHFLDEADFLADHIAILSEGELKAEGSSAELKQRLGNGYNIEVNADPASIQLSRDTEIEQKIVSHNNVTFRVPSAAATSTLIGELERQGIYDYHVLGPTIEQLFLKMTSSSDSEDSNDTLAIEGTCNLQDGKTISLFKQGWFLFLKRFTVLRRKFMPYFLAIAVALVGCGVSIFLIKHYTRLSCPSTPSEDDIQAYDYVVSLGERYFRNYEPTLVMGPASQISNGTLSKIADLYKSLSEDDYSGIANFSTFFQSIKMVETLDEFNKAIESGYDTVQPGGIFLDPPTIAWVADYADSPGMMVQNLLDILTSGTSIFTGYESFGTFGSAPLYNFWTLVFLIIFCLLFACYPAFFALYPATERLNRVRAMEYSNGVLPAPLWLAYFAFDTLFVLVISIVSIVLLSVGWHQWFGPTLLFVVLLLYGMSSTLLAYLISMFAPSPLAAWAFCATGQTLMLFAYFGGQIGIVSRASLGDLQGQLSALQYGIGVISPVANLVRALVLGLGMFSTTCGDTSQPSAIGLYGSPIMYLAIQIAVLFAVILIWDYRTFSALLTRSRPQPHAEATVASVDDELGREIARVQRATNGLRVSRLTKAFGKNRAVDDVTFGVAPGEIFALLGPNGAGKSTVVSLVRGDIRPSAPESSIYIEQSSVLTQLATARSQLGVCPQFDSADLLTVGEILTFYARIRGVPNPAHNVNEVISACGLEKWRKQRAQALSGGTKRKLSLAIALIGNPRVLLLDEPSSGLDAKAKRAMWSTLASVGKNRAIVLTTHSMEEADALAHRVGIMSGKMLALGTVDEMRHRGGDTYHVHLVCETAPRTTDEETESIRRWVEGCFPDAHIEQRTVRGQLRFSLAAAHSDMSIGQIFRMLEANKRALGVGNYSVGRTTLDEVFVSVVRAQGGHEENSGVVEKKPGFFRF